MATMMVTLSDEETEHLTAVAAARDLTPEALVARWVRERLVHERERAAGGGMAQSPRARRQQEPSS